MAQLKAISSCSPTSLAFQVKKRGTKFWALSVFLWFIYLFFWDLFSWFNHMQCLHVNLKIIFKKISGFKLFYEKNDFLAPKIVSFIFVIFVFCEIYLYVSITFCICMLIEKIFFWLFNNSGFKLFCEKNDFLAPKIVSFVIIIFVLWDLFAWFNHILYLHVNCTTFLF